MGRDLLVVLCIFHADIVGECLFEALIQRVCPLGIGRAQRNDTKRKHEEEYLDCMFHCSVILNRLQTVYSFSKAANCARFRVEPLNISQ